MSKVCKPQLRSEHYHSLLGSSLLGPHGASALPGLYILDPGGTSVVVAPCSTASAGAAEAQVSKPFANLAVAHAPMAAVQNVGGRCQREPHHPSAAPTAAPRKLTTQTAGRK